MEVKIHKVEVNSVSGIYDRAVQIDDELITVKNNTEQRFIYEMMLAIEKLTAENEALRRVVKTETLEVVK